MIEKQQQIAGIAETVPSCNYCVATIVARPLRTTVKGGKSGGKSGANNGEGWKKIRALFTRIQESGGVSGLKLLSTYMNF